MTTVAIDYTPAIRQSAGIGRIIRGQVKALAELQLDWDLRLFVVGAVTAADRATAPLPLATTPISERNMVRIWHRFDIGLPRIEWLTGGPLDLLHATDFVLPPSKARTKILTVHDLAFLFYPDAAMPGLHRYLNVVVPRSIDRADHIIADSHNTARDLHDQWNVPESRISVVQGAVDHDRFQPQHDRDRQNALRTKYNLGAAPFVLGISKLEPRKNFERLIRAFALARADAGFPHRLVIGGAKGWLYESIFATVTQLGLQESVLFPGFVDDQDLPVLYSMCEFFAYPSLYEGFGLPIIEALACGVPVLTADNSCLSEAAGPGAIYVQAEDVESIANGITTLVENASLRNQLAHAGRIHARTFTWERSAEQLLTAYRDAMEQTS